LIGAINIPGGFPLLGKIFGEHKFSDWLIHSVVNAHAGKFNWWLAVSAVGLAVGAIYAARQLYSDNVLASVRRQDPLQANSQTASGFALANAKLYWDEIYFRFIENPYNAASNFLANTVDWGFWHNFFHERVMFGSFHEAARGMSNSVDRGAIDRGILLVAGRSIAMISGRIRHIQTGYVRTYALSVLLGTVVVILVILLPVIRDLLNI
jgi:NADH:ubiquinone oxidoreductase subunit 5 (subunit L)/multisubunit Na+/H+ antiporter MnhA subunit